MEQGLYKNVMILTNDNLRGYSIDKKDSIESLDLYDFHFDKEMYQKSDLVYYLNSGQIKVFKDKFGGFYEKNKDKFTLENFCKNLIREQVDPYFTPSQPVKYILTRKGKEIKK